MIRFIHSREYITNMATNDLMTTKELAEYLQLDRMTIYKLLKSGDIPANRVGHQWRFFRSDIDSWIRSKKVTPQDFEF